MFSLFITLKFISLGIRFDVWGNDILFQKKDFLK